MVTQSKVNYAQHKIDIYNIIKEKYNEKKADKFIQHYSNRYDKYNRSFIDWKLAYWLMDDYAYLQKKGSKWYAIVGIGGTGKTTLGKNVMYFLDDAFDLKMLAFDIDKFVKNLASIPRVNAKRSLLLDEPDDKYHMSSERGKVLRRILGKLRQQQVAICLCATDLNDIPQYMFRKIDGIFFLPELGKGLFFKNKAKSKSYLIQQIRRDYSQKGYSVFFELQRKAGCLQFSTIKDSPFDLEQKKEYLDIKEKDYDSDIQQFLKLNRDNLDEKNEKKQDKRIEIALKLHEEGITDEIIGKGMGISRSMVSILRKKGRNNVDIVPKSA